MSASPRSLFTGRLSSMRSAMSAEDTAASQVPIVCHLSRPFFRPLYSHCSLPMSV